MWEQNGTTGKPFTPTITIPEERQSDAERGRERMEQKMKDAKKPKTNLYRYFFT